jgi:hypothetical protein
MRENLQLRFEILPGKAGFQWSIVSLQDKQVDEFIVSGAGHDLDKTLSDAGKTLLKEAYDNDPCRHDWDCDCGARLVIEARRSRRSPYSWDSPREITCSCGRSYGVKLNFATGRSTPFIEALPRC